MMWPYEIRLKYLLAEHERDLTLYSTLLLPSFNKGASRRSSGAPQSFLLRSMYSHALCMYQILHVCTCDTTLLLPPIICPWLLPRSRITLSARERHDDDNVHHQPCPRVQLHTDDIRWDDDLLRVHSEWDVQMIQSSCNNYPSASAICTKHYMTSSFRAP